MCFCWLQVGEMRVRPAGPPRVLPWHPAHAMALVQAFTETDPSGGWPWQGGLFMQPRLAPLAVAYGYELMPGSYRLIEWCLSALSALPHLFPQPGL